MPLSRTNLQAVSIAMVLVPCNINKQVYSWHQYGILMCGMDPERRDTEGKVAVEVRVCMLHQAQVQHISW